MRYLICSIRSIMWIVSWIVDELFTIRGSRFLLPSVIIQVFPTRNVPIHPVVEHKLFHDFLYICFCMSFTDLLVDLINLWVLF